MLSFYSVPPILFCVWGFVICVLCVFVFLPACVFCVHGQSIEVWSCANDLPVAQTSVKCVKQKGRENVGGRERWIWKDVICACSSLPPSSIRPRTDCTACAEPQPPAPFNLSWSAQLSTRAAAEAAALGKSLSRAAAPNWLVTEGWKEGWMDSRWMHRASPWCLSYSHPP